MDNESRDATYTEKTCKEQTKKKVRNVFKTHLVRQCLCLANVVVLQSKLDSLPVDDAVSAEAWQPSAHDDDTDESPSQPLTVTLPATLPGLTLSSSFIPFSSLQFSTPESVFAQSYSKAIANVTPFTLRTIQFPTERGK